MQWWRTWIERIRAWWRGPGPRLSTPLLPRVEVVIESGEDREMIKLLCDLTQRLEQPTRHVKSPAELRAWRRANAKLATFIRPAPSSGDLDAISREVADRMLKHQWDDGWTHIRMPDDRVVEVTQDIRDRARIFRMMALVNQAGGCP